MYLIDCSENEGDSESSVSYNNVNEDDENYFFFNMASTT
jgi:hypothetical protein